MYVAFTIRPHTQLACGTYAGFQTAWGAERVLKAVAALERPSPRPWSVG